jgi:hypothetical protein
MYKMVDFTSTFLKQQSAQECIIDASAREGFRFRDIPEPKTWNIS